MKVRYTGAGDYRILDASDIPTTEGGAELDFSKKIFSKGKAVKVDDEVGQFLIDHADAFGEFEEAPEGTASTDGVEEPMTDATTNADAGESAEEAGGHSQETGDMPATTTPTPGTASGRPSTRGRSTR